MFYFWSFPWTFFGPSLLLSSNIPYPFWFHYFLCSFLFRYKLLSIKSLYFIDFNNKKFPTSLLQVRVPLSHTEYSSPFLTSSKVFVLCSDILHFSVTTVPLLDCPQSSSQTLWTQFKLEPCRRFRCTGQATPEPEPQMRFRFGMVPNLEPRCTQCTKAPPILCLHLWTPLPHLLPHESSTHVNWHVRACSWDKEGVWGSPAVGGHSGIVCNMSALRLDVRDLDTAVDPCNTFRSG